MTRLELALVLASALLHALWSVAIKGSRDPLAFNVLQLVPPLAAACALPWLAPLGALPPRAWGLVAATGVAHGLYYYWLSRALERGDLSLVYPIARSAPAFVPFVAVAWLGESLSARGAFGIAVVVLGMWTAAVEGGLRGGRLAAPGSGLALLTLAASVAYSLIDKASMRTLAPFEERAVLPMAAVYYLLLCAACSVVFVPLALRRVGVRGLRAAARTQLGPAALAAVVGFLGYGLILHALRTAPVSYVVAVRQTSVLFALALGALLLRERPSRPRLLGAVLTALGVAIVSAS